MSISLKTETPPYHVQDTWENCNRLPHTGHWKLRYRNARL